MERTVVSGFKVGRGSNFKVNMVIRCLARLLEAKTFEAVIDKWRSNA